jgi:predicted nucleotidyltransferase
MDPSAQATETIERVGARLAAVDGVRGVVLGGSRARGISDAQADIDIGVYYDAADPPALAELEEAIRELGDRDTPVVFAPFGEWGPWINGGAWMTVGGNKTDVLFRELGKVGAVVHDCQQGKVAAFYQPGHPHCFVNAIYAGELFHCDVLAERDGTISALKGEVDPYPEPLARALVAKFGWEGEFALEIAGGAAARGDISYVFGCGFRAVACTVQALFAANRTYLINEKGGVDACEQLERHPPEFAARVNGALAGLADEATRSEALTALREVVAEAGALIQ